MKPVTPAPLRFWPKVDKNGPVSERRPELGRCWIWTGARLKSGYGSFRTDGKAVRAHRWSYEDFYGAIPDKHVLDHLCGVVLCVNPLHLEPVTQRENVIRGKSRITECPAGHPYDQENTYVDLNGARRCRECGRETARRRKAKRDQLLLATPHTE